MTKCKNKIKFIYFLNKKERNKNLKNIKLKAEFKTTIQKAEKQRDWVIRKFSQKVKNVIKKTKEKELKSEK